MPIKFEGGQWSYWIASIYYYIGEAREREREWQRESGYIIISGRMDAVFYLLYGGYIRQLKYNEVNDVTSLPLSIIFWGTEVAKNIIWTMA